MLAYGSVEQAMFDWFYFSKLDNAITRRKACSKHKILENVCCEACGTKISIYCGTIEGILCSDCGETIIQRHYCGNTEPLPAAEDPDYEFADA